MDIDQIKCVMAVVREGTFLEASFSLNRSQSSVSKEIRKLEIELGCTLFVRTSRHVHLTPEGEEFVLYGQKILDAHQELLTAIGRHRIPENSRLRIGTIYFGKNNRLAPVIAGFVQQNPAVEISMQDGTTTPLVEALRNKELDAVFVSSMYAATEQEHTFSSDSQFRTFSCFRDPYCVVVNRDHPFANRKSLTVPELDGQAFILLDSSMDVYDRAIHRLFEYYDVQVHTSVRCTSVRSALHMVSHGLGIAILSRLVVEDSDSLKIIPLEGGLIRDTQMLILNQPQPLHIESFWQFIRKEFS